MPDLSVLTISVFQAIEDDIEEVATNLHMLQNVVDAHSLTSPDLQFVAFPGGSRVSFTGY
jgi:hypothetical protein